MTDPQPHTGRRSAARLAAVQALYEIDMVGAPATPVLQEFLENRWSNATPIDEDDRDDALTSVDPKDVVGAEPRYLKRLVRGVAEHDHALDKSITAHLMAGRVMDHLDALVRSILRAGAFEIIHCPEIRPRTVISEYVNLSHAFFSGNEPSLVNAVLDALAREFRSGEMSEPAAGSG